MNKFFKLRSRMLNWVILAAFILEILGHTSAAILLIVVGTVEANYNA